MRLFKNPLFALFLCLVLIFTSSVVSTKVKIAHELVGLLDSYSSDPGAYSRKVDEISSLSSRFPGCIFIKAAGINIPNP